MGFSRDFYTSAAQAMQGPLARGIADSFQEGRQARLNQADFQRARSAFPQAAYTLEPGWRFRLYGAGGAQEGGLPDAAVESQRSLDAMADVASRARNGQPQ